MDRLMNRDGQTPAGGNGGTGQVREDWVRDSTLSGFVATFAMTITLALAYAFANAVGNFDAGTLQRWFAGLTENEMTRMAEMQGGELILAMVFNLIMGLVWAVIYGRVAEPMLRGPGWRKGILFSLVPFLLSIFVFFPAVGVGVLGMGIDAGPLPVLGNLILHVVYGAVLGAMYAIETDTGLGTATGEHQAAVDSERGAAIGVAIGVVFGVAAGWLVGPGLSDLADRTTIAIAGAFTGGAIGILIGSLVGMRDQTEGRRVL